MDIKLSLSIDRSNANVETIIHIISSEEATENESAFYIEVLANILEYKHALENKICYKE